MAVGLVVGGWFASAVISKLINELIEYAKDQKKMQLGLKDELTRLRKALPKIQAVVNAVDQGLIREENPALEKWLWQFRDAADQADDVMDEIKYNYEKERALNAEKNKVDKAITDFRTFFLRAIKKDHFLNRLMEAVKKMDEVATEIVVFYTLVQGSNRDQKEMVKLTISSRQTRLVLRTRVFGREKEEEDIIKKLLNPVCKTEGKNFAVLPIIGVGGVGKTTLAQLVYNDPTVIQHFELRMWVCISNNFDVELITKKLYEFVFKKKADFESCALIQTELIEKLKSQRFLVVFDDIWNENDKLGWEELVAPLKHGKNGSMILLTTRLKTVATLVGPNVMDSIILESLNEYDMWDLFKEYAFGGEDPDYHKEVVEIGRDIVKKLKGSPLAAKTVGGILCSDLSEVHWRSILESELWSLEQTHNDIMPALRLTYQNLSPHLKPCFSFCSIFPKDHVFRKHDLINMWIALGMVSPRFNNTMRPEDVGSKYFDEMINKSIFIYFENEDKFVMHDLIHDLSIFVSQGECLTTSTKKVESIPNTVRHLYVDINSSCGLSISGLRNLRTLILHCDSCQPDSLVTEMLKGMEILRLLILLADNLSEIPKCVNKLLHLRYLNISSHRINAVPKSVSALYLLETMVCDVLDINQLEQVNAWGRLINLRHLTAQDELLDNTAGIGRLTLLQELSFNVGKDDGFKICELSDMKDLRRLIINRIEDVGSREEVEQANLKDKVSLNILRLNWDYGNPNKPHLNEDVLDHLEPPHGLKELVIYNYRGTGRPPIWFTTQGLSKLVRLIIHDCTFENLPCLEELPLLKYIDFDSLNAVKVIIHECNRSLVVDAFPSLEVLKIDSMWQLEEWCLEKQPNKWMQCLRKLNVSDCQRLQVLPPVPLCVKELKFAYLGLNALPSLWNDQSRKSGSLSDLVDMSISHCDSIVSLNEGLFQNPDRFVNLEKLEIAYCWELMNLPPGGFNKFISLKELIIRICQKIVVQEECFLPSALQMLRIGSCGHLEKTLSKALENVHSLIELRLHDCENITSLPPKEVFSRCKTLKRLTFLDCLNLSSLDSLLGLSSIERLSIYKCPELSQAIASPLSLENDETERKEDGTTQTSDRNDEVNSWFLACSIKALTFFRSLLYTLFYFILRMFMPKLKRSVSTQPQLPSPITQEKPLLSVDEIGIDDPLLLSIEPIRSLSAVNKLIIFDGSMLQSLPELPPILQELRIYCCCPELQMRCMTSGPDWPKLS
ncbi:disease resistance protein RGA2-like isoform X2 [Carex rostrata]